MKHPAGRLNLLVFEGEIWGGGEISPLKALKKTLGGFNLEQG